MKIGVVISGGDVTGINNFIFQVARLAQADIILFNGGIPGLLANQHHPIAQRDLGNDSNLLIVFYVQIMPDDFVMQLHRF
ncbi:Uncharacterised protein [Serratia liquefaciens]|nr:Uncharacterised protein [Serratia liquefaciens]